MDLESLYASKELAGNTTKCEGCSILKANKPCHAVMDYRDKPQSDVLFLSDSLKYKQGLTIPFYKEELELLSAIYPGEFETAASVKCPGVKESDMKTEDFHICRQYLEETIDKIKPRLIMPCGNMAMKMLIKKSGITSKRGKAFEYETTAGHKAVVVPIYHPLYCAKEPRHLPLLVSDITNAYEKYVLGNKGEGFSYRTLLSVKDVRDFAEKVKDSTEPVACDIETTGLNFLKDKIMTVGLSWSSTPNGDDLDNVVIPLFHRESPWNDEEAKEVISLLKGILENPNKLKILHNAKFDLKFLFGINIWPKNIWDTKIGHHMYDENLPKGLMDLVKLYFGNELESL